MVAQSGEFLKGFFGATLILFLATAVFATWYASEIDMGGHSITFDSGYVVNANDYLATKSYVDSKGLSTTCAFVSVSTTDCNSGYCYANKPTADKVCQQNSYNFSASYQYYKYSGSAGTGSSNLWNGNGWTSITGDDSYSPPPVGGGQYYSTYNRKTSYLNYVYCCKV